GLGQVFIELKDFQRARFNFTKAVALERDNPVYRFWLCRANELLGDRIGARAQCEQALKLRPDFREAQEVLNRLR
ncbi:tetratricopeptide repeat protein, partial [uncultured Meiothermus sp.]|uniref:tetratricopeptide repeat protein n=1 Tax=uncultured Meiothermus sp. TaxID=157471 RepID=UPI00345302FC